MRACISVCLAELAKDTKAPPISSEPLFSRALYALQRHAPCSVAGGNDRVKQWALSCMGDTGCQPEALASHLSAARPFTNATKAKPLVVRVALLMGTVTSWTLPNCSKISFSCFWLPWLCTEHAGISITEEHGRACLTSYGAGCSLQTQCWGERTVLRLATYSTRENRTSTLRMMAHSARSSFTRRLLPSGQPASLKAWARFWTSSFCSSPAPLPSFLSPWALCKMSSPTALKWLLCPRHECVSDAAEQR